MSSSMLVSSKAQGVAARSSQRSTVVAACTPIRPSSSLVRLSKPQLAQLLLATHPAKRVLSTTTQAVRADAPTDQLDSATLKLIADITKEVDDRVVSVVRQNTADAASTDLTVRDSLLRAKVVAGIKKLSKGLLEREIEVRLLLLASLCGEHILLLGPPGTAKSELSRRLSSLCGGKYYERLLTRFSVPEELFGPLSMKGLENDEYVRQVEGYLPTAEVAFVDEIFKANSAILNALLTLLNERLFDNGNQRYKVPLLTLVGASNELPESEELDALYDRFLIRKTVAQVSNNQLYKLARLAAGRQIDLDAPSGNGYSLASGSSVSASLDIGDDAAAAAAAAPLGIEDFRATADLAYAAVDVPDTVIDILTSTRNYLQDKCEPPIYVSDRRFMKAVQMLQVVAYADGRSEVNEYDCLLLEHVFGNRPDDSHKVRAYVLETIASDPGLQQTELVFLGLFGRACRVLEAGKGNELSEALDEAQTLVGLLEERHKALSVALDGSFPELRATLWQSEATVQTAVQALTPQMTENRKKAEDLLREAALLANCLGRATSPRVLERLLPKRFKQYQKGISGKTA